MALIRGALQSLVNNENGRRIIRDAFRYQLDNAREIAGIEKTDFQFMDLKAKAAAPIPSKVNSKVEVTHDNKTLLA